MQLSPEDNATICEKILKWTEADSAEVSLGDAENLYLRSANNDLTSNGLVSGVDVGISVSFGKRSASISVNQTSEAALREALKKVEAMARLAPEDPEHLPPVEPGRYLEPLTWSDATAAWTPGEALEQLRPVIEASRRAKVDGASYLERRVSRSTYANSRGVLLAQGFTTVNFSITARSAEGRGSGWASTQVTEVGELDLEPVGATAIAKALESRNAKPHPAGRTTVVLEAAAAREILNLLSWGLDRRDFDEGRSFLNGLATQEGQVLDQTLFNPKVTLLSDPRSSAAPGPVHQSGQVLTATTWIEKGVLKTLPVSRYWAQQKKIVPQPWPSNLIFPGEGKSRDELIAAVEDGILITRFWYLRLVQPQTLLYTGLTRDGTFAIRDGKIVGPVNNFRFNESPVTVLKNLVATGTPERVLGSESGMPVLAPMMVVRDFNLSSVSDAS